ncbi:Pantothenate kinase [Kluyveromyces marxianus]|nr:Pantothenate kinase [Kluyveromyces marxianus]KAG0681776.1 Pantothenate kinase [Kluyveromyces marxianus]
MTSDILLSHSQLANTSKEDVQDNCSTFTIAVDIGGSLAKVVFMPPNSSRLMFRTLETERIDEFMQLLHDIIQQYHDGLYEQTLLVATGGGSYKFYDLMVKQFPTVIGIERSDEMDCLIKGLDFFIHEIPNEIFTYNDLEGENAVEPSHNCNSIYPYMLVNIGSGVSILKVDSPKTFSRVGGSSLGGGTLWGLLSLITGAKSFDEMLSWAHKGDNTNVDMLVGDIYGTAYDKLGLKSTHIASSFGKVFQNRSHVAHENTRYPSPSTTSTDIIQSDNKFNNADISKSLLYAVSNNIGQIAYLQAKIHHVKNIYFGGSYIRGHYTTMNTLSYAINFWSEGEKQAFFLKHEGYLGAMGAYLLAQRQKT